MIISAALAIHLLLLLRPCSWEIRDFCRTSSIINRTMLYSSSPPSPLPSLAFRRPFPSTISRSGVALRWPVNFNQLYCVRDCTKWLLFSLQPICKHCQECRESEKCFWATHFGGTKNNLSIHNNRNIQKTISFQCGWNGVSSRLNPAHPLIKPEFTPG